MKCLDENNSVVHSRDQRYKTNAAVDGFNATLGKNQLNFGNKNCVSSVGDRLAFGLL